MAGLKASDVQYILNTIPIGDFMKAFKLDNTFIDLLGGFKVGKGRIQTPIHYAGNSTANSFAESADLSAAGTQARRTLDHSYRRVYVTPGLDGLQEAIASAGGIQNITDLMLAEVQGAVEDLLDEINTQLLSDGTGNSNADIDGIQFQVADDNTWGGLARGSYSWLQSYVLDNSGTDRDLTLALLRSMGDTLDNTRKSKWDAIFTSKTVYNAYEDLFGDKKRIDMVETKAGDLVQRRLAYDNRPIYAIPGYDTNRMDFVERKNLSIQYLPQTARDTLNRVTTGIFKVEPVSVVSDDSAFNIIAYLNLVATNPWKCGSLQDVQ